MCEHHITTLDNHVFPSVIFTPLLENSQELISPRITRSKIINMSKRMQVLLPPSAWSR